MMFMPEVDGVTAGQATVMLKWIMGMRCDLKCMNFSTNSLLVDSLT